MPKPKTYKFLGPWLRKIRVDNRITRVDLSKRISRSGQMITFIEGGFNKMPNLATLKAWLTAINALDQFDTAKKLYMIDGPTLEVCIRKLALDTRLRLFAIFNLISSKDCPPELVQMIDAILSKEPVTIVNMKQPGYSPAIGDRVCRTEFDLDYFSQEIMGVRESDEYQRKS